MQYKTVPAYRNNRPHGLAIPAASLIGYSISDVGAVQKASVGRQTHGNSVCGMTLRVLPQVAQDICAGRPTELLPCVDQLLSMI